MFKACFIIALAIIAAAVAAALSRRRSFGERTAALLLGALGAIIALAYPVFRLSQGRGAPLSGVLAVLYGFLSLTGEQDALALLEADLGSIAAAYRGLLGALFVAAPVLATGFVLTLFSGLSDFFARLALALLGGELLPL